MIVDHLSYTLSMLQVYGCCIFLVFVLPMLMWRRYLRDKSLTERFLFCLITQTFFYVNVVLLLGFLNICNRWTLMGATVLEYLLVRWTYSDRSFFKRLRKGGETVWLVLRRRQTWHSLLRQIRTGVRMRLREIPGWPIWGKLRKHWFEIALLAAFLVWNALFLTHNVRLYHSYQFCFLGGCSRGQGLSPDDPPSVVYYGCPCFSLSILYLTAPVREPYQLTVF